MRHPTPRSAFLSSTRALLVTAMAAACAYSLSACGSDGFDTAEAEQDAGSGGASAAAGSGGAAAESGGAVDSGAVATASGGYGGLGPGVNTGGTGGQASTAPAYEDAWFQCTSDADCKVILLRACCVCTTMALNSAHEQDVIRVGSNQDGCAVNCGPAPCPNMPSGAVCTAGRCQEAVNCEGITDLIACSEMTACRWMTGKTCGSDAAAEPVGCFPAAPGLCDETPTCGEDPATGERFVFQRDCLPEGWTPCGGSDCAG